MGLLRDCQLAHIMRMENPRAQPSLSTGARRRIAPGTSWALLAPLQGNQAAQLWLFSFLGPVESWTAKPPAAMDQRRDARGGEGVFEGDFPLRGQSWAHASTLPFPWAIGKEFRSRTASERQATAPQHGSARIRAYSHSGTPPRPSTERQARREQPLRALHGLRSWLRSHGEVVPGRGAKHREPVDGSPACYSRGKSPIWDRRVQATGAHQPSLGHSPHQPVRSKGSSPTGGGQPAHAGPKRRCDNVPQ